MAKKSKHPCFKLMRVATIKCFYMPSSVEMTKYLKLNENEKKSYVNNFLNKYNLDRKNLRELTLIYNFEVGAEIPLKMPEQNIHPVTYYHTC